MQVRSPFGLFWKIEVWLLVAVLVTLATSCTGQANRFEENHREFHRGHVSFLENQREQISDHLDRFITSLETAENTEVQLATWDSILGLVDETGHKNEVYAENCLVEPETMDAITAMQAARGNLSSEVLSGRTELEIAIRQGNAVTAVSHARELAGMIVAELVALETGARDYLEFLVGEDWDTR